MRHNNVRQGMKVKIMKMDTTHRRHNSCHEMKRMIGKTYKVRNIQPSSYADRNSGDIMVTVEHPNQGFVWAPEDLAYAGPEIKLPKKATFDPDNLVRP